MTTTDEQLLVPRHKARHILGDIGETKLWELDKTGEIEVVHIGRRAFVTAESLRSYVERLREAEAATEPAGAGEPEAKAAAQQEVHGEFAGAKALAQQQD